MNIEDDLNELTSRIEVREDKVKKEVLDLQNKERTYSRYAWGAVWIGLFVGLIGVFKYVCFDVDSGAEFGLNLLGDYLAGSVASIWSLAGLFFIYVAFLGQKQQLLNQQLEMLYSQREIKYTQREFHYQKKEMKEQNFQTTFFNLLKTQQSITQEINCKIKIITEDANIDNIELKGRQFFDQAKLELEYLCEGISHPKYVEFDDVIEIDFAFQFGGDAEKRSRLREKRKQFSLKEYGILNETEWNKVNMLHRSEVALKAYDLFFERNQYVIGHYFRHLYHILSFLSLEKANRIESTSKNDIPGIVKEMDKYSDFIQSQLSTYELFLLFYNSQNYDKLQICMIEFDFYKHIPSNALLFKEDRNLLSKLREKSKSLNN
jgi:hypothetical protein